MGAHRASKLCAAAAFMAVGAIPFKLALADDSRTLLAVDIDPQPLEAALVELSKQGHLQLVISTGSLPARNSQPLHGTMALGAALDNLLKGTGLTYKFVGEHTIAIVTSGNQVTQLSEPPDSPGISGETGSEGALPDNTVRKTSKEKEPNRGERSVKHSKIYLRLAAILGICVSAAGSGTACAEDVATGSNANPAAESESVEQIVVTGSRVITNGNDNPTPTAVVTADELARINPGPMLQALSALPQLPATPNQGAQGQGPQGLVNLRGIGFARNLIQFDGFRVGFTFNGFAGQGVDSNLIPQLLLKRVDIVTGGASAVYGSDAVSGVVNYVVDHDFNGVKIVGQAGETTYRDDHSWNAGIAAGMRLLDGRAHIEFSYQDFNNPGIRNRFDREWGRGLWSIQGGGTAANPFNLYSNTRLGFLSFGGLISSGPLAGLNFTQNGVLTPFVHGQPTPTPGVEIGGDGGYFSAAWAIAKQDSQNGLLRLDFDATERVHAFAQLAVGNVFYVVNDFPGNSMLGFFGGPTAIGYNNAYLGGIQPGYQALIAGQDPLSSFSFAKMITGDQMPGPTSNVSSTQYLFQTGLDGSWGAYKWNVGYERQDELAKYEDPNSLNNGRLYAALNAVINPANNQVVCHAALVNPAYANCVPLNVFGPGSVSPQAFQYVRQDVRNDTRYQMDDFVASINGAPISDWAGPVNMALSAEWRRNSYEVTSNALPTDVVDCNGIQFNCGPGTPAYTVGAQANFPKASEHVVEAAYEVDLPLLKDLAFAKSLNLNGAARYTNYQASGSVATWKLGATWHLNDAFTVRTTRSRDIRAPSITDLYQPATQGLDQFTDLHTGVTASVTEVTQGNPNLKPEDSDTTTFGIVWKPQFIDGASLSLDYYHIKITNGLVTLQAHQQVNELACEKSGGTSPVCDLYVRPHPFSDTSPDNFPILAYNEQINSAGLLTYGLDLELDYAHRLFGRPFSSRLLVTYQPHLIYDTGPGGKFDVGGAADGIGGLPNTPSVRGLLELNYEVSPNLTTSIQERYRNALKQFADSTPPFVFAQGDLAAAAYTDANVNYRWKLTGADLDTYFNIRNVFNTQPHPWASSGGGSLIGAFGGYNLPDDNIGRYFTVGFRLKF